MTKHGRLKWHSFETKIDAQACNVSYKQMFKEEVFRHTNSAGLLSFYTYILSKTTQCSDTHTLEDNSVFRHKDSVGLLSFRTHILRGSIQFSYSEGPSRCCTSFYGLKLSGHE